MRLREVGFEVDGRLSPASGNPTHRSQVGRLRPADPSYSALKFAAVLGSSMLMAGCAMIGPDYKEPPAPEAKEGIERDDPRVKSQPADLSHWWTVFNDSTLDQLIELAYQQNLSLKVAGVRILEARALLGIAIGSLYPQEQSLGGDYTLAGISKHQANTTAGADLNFAQAAVGFGAAWEIDLWGKFRRAVESNFAILDNSVAGYDDVLVSLTADVAATYVAIRTFQSRLEVARHNVRIQKRTMQIAQAQFDGGLVSELDVQQARNLLKTTEASIPPLETGLRQSRNALAVLLGLVAGELPNTLATAKPIPSAPKEVAVGIPAELLRRRPDIRRAERETAAQSALIGVAKADLYPHFALFGTLGFRASDAAVTAASLGGSNLGDLFSSQGFEWSFGPSFRWDIFNYGRIKNRVRVEDARFQQLAVNYQNAVLRAVREVEDALVGFLKAHEQRDFLAEAVDAAKRSVALAQTQYKEGLVDYVRVLDAERTLASAQDNLLATDGSIATNLIGTYRALGGGWELRVGKEFVSPETRQEMENRTDWGSLLQPQKVSPPPAKERSLLRAPDW